MKTETRGTAEEKETPCVRSFFFFFFFLNVHYWLKFNQRRKAQLWISFMYVCMYIPGSSTSLTFFFPVRYSYIPFTADTDMGSRWMSGKQRRALLKVEKKKRRKNHCRIERITDMQLELQPPPPFLTKLEL